MDQLLNTFSSLGETIEIVTSSINFIIGLIGYLPAVLGSAVLIALTVYIVRFCLLK